jgi:hypothetical protein
MKQKLPIYVSGIFRLAKSVFPPEEDNYKHIYEGASPDTLVWKIGWVTTKP